MLDGMNQRKKLLIFTEHKDTLDYLIEHLEPTFEVARIHGGLKLAERIAAPRRVALDRSASASDMSSSLAPSR